MSKPNSRRRRSTQDSDHALSFSLPLANKRRLVSDLLPSNKAHLCTSCPTLTVVAVASMVAVAAAHGMVLNLIMVLRIRHRKPTVDHSTTMMTSTSTAMMRPGQLLILLVEVSQFAFFHGVKVYRAEAASAVVVDSIRNVEEEDHQEDSEAGVGGQAPPVAS